jgi:hypothetical protein
VRLASSLTSMPGVQGGPRGRVKGYQGHPLSTHDGTSPLSAGGYR